MLPVAATPPTARCPRCATDLAPCDTDQQITLAQCPSCLNLWFARGELGRLLGTPSDLDAPVRDDLPLLGHDPQPCPRCADATMNCVPFRANTGIFVDRCPCCEGVWASVSALASMRQFARTAKAWQVKPTWAREESRAAVVAEPTEATELSFKRTLIALPTAFALSALWRVVPLSQLVPGGVATPLHELGHASASWWVSVPAVPIPFGLTVHAGGRSVLLWAVLQAALGFAVFAALRHRARGWALAALTLLIAHDFATLTFTAAQREAWFLWAGCAGEIVFAAAPLALFHVALAPRLRWDIARWIAMPAGAFLLLDRAVFWRLCLHNRDLIPWGAAFSDDESDGDLTRLVERHAWGTVKIVHSYVNLSTVCLAITLVAWLLALARARRRETSSRLDVLAPSGG